MIKRNRRIKVKLQIPKFKMSIATYIEAFTQLNGLKPCPMIINGKLLLL